MAKRVFNVTFDQQQRDNTAYHQNTKYTIHKHTNNLSNNNETRRLQNSAVHDILSVAHCIEWQHICTNHINYNYTIPVRVTTLRVHVHFAWHTTHSPDWTFAVRWINSWILNEWCRISFSRNDNIVALMDSTKNITQNTQLDAISQKNSRFVFTPPCIEWFLNEYTIDSRRSWVTVIKIPKNSICSLAFGFHLFEYGENHFEMRKFFFSLTTKLPTIFQNFIKKTLKYKLVMGKSKSPMKFTTFVSREKFPNLGHCNKSLTRDFYLMCLEINESSFFRKKISISGSNFEKVQKTGCVHFFMKIISNVDKLLF